MNISLIKEAALRGASRALIIGKKFAPDILVGAGIAGTVTGTVMIAKATLDLEPIVDTLNQNKEYVKHAYEDGQDLDYKKALAACYFSAGKSIAKLYGPGIMLMAGSIGMILGSHGIMRKRNAALAAAYSSLDASFKRYRESVKEEYGEDADAKLVFKEHERAKAEKEANIDTPAEPSFYNGYSQYARVFDESCPEWDKNHDYNMHRLICIQNLMNQRLNSRGHVFLNEVYDALGFPRTSAGAIVGWVIQDGHDNVVDFGIFDATNDKARDFVNGYERGIVLDFNVDGVIYDQI